MKNSEEDNVVSFQKYVESKNQQIGKNEEKIAADISTGFDISIEDLAKMIEEISNLGDSSGDNFQPMMFIMNSHGNHEISSNRSTEEIIKELSARLASEGRDDLADLTEEILEMYSDSKHDSSQQVPLFDIAENISLKDDTTLSKEEEEKARNIINFCIKHSKE